MFRLHWSNSLILTSRRKFRLWKWEWVKQMQTNATRDLLTKGSSSWQWDVTGGQSSLHLTSQIKMLYCTPLLKIFKAKCTLTDIKYTPLSDNKTSPVTREVANPMETDSCHSLHFHFFTSMRCRIWQFTWCSYSDLWHIFIGGCWPTTLGKNSIWSFLQVMEKFSASLSSSDDNPHEMQEDKYRQRWTKYLTNWREHSSHIFKFRHSSRSATPFPLFRLLGR